MPWRVPLLALFLAAALAGPAAAKSPRIVEYPIPTPESKPVGIAAGPEGAMWFTEGAADRIGRVGSGGRVEEVASTPQSFPGGANGPAWIVAGPGGDMWFTQGNPSGVGHLGLAGHLTEFRLPAEPRKPIGIALGADGNIWFADRWGAIWRATPDGRLTEFPVKGPINYEPNGIAAGPDGALWFTARGFIGRLTTDGQERRFPVPSHSGNLRQIVAGPDRSLWFTDQGGRGADGVWRARIGRITTGGRVTEFTIPTEEADPVGIAVGPDRNLWFTEQHGNAIGRITPAGRITEFPLSLERGRPFGIAAGPDGDLWFTESFGNSIGRIRPRLRGAEIASSRGRVRGGRVRLEISCSGDLGAGCHGKVRLRSGRQLARAGYKMPAESTRSVTLALNRRGRGLLRREPAPRIDASVSVVGGQSGTRTIVLRRG